VADGILVAKFMPPNEGHEALLDFASRYVDRLKVFLACSDDDPIPAERRLKWVRRLFGSFCQSEVVNLDITEEAIELWAEQIRQLKGWDPEYFFAPEPFGVALGERIEAKLVTVDPSLGSAELISTSIRQSPSVHWHRLSPPIKRELLKRVCVFGPESTGKSTLCEKLARHYHTVMVPEYSRTYLEQKDGDYELCDVVPVARGQRAAEFACGARAKRLLLCDTDLLTLKIWSDWLFGECDDWIEQRLDQERYDLYLLCCADVPWEEDEVRYLPNDRENFEERCEEVLKDYDCRYRKIRGDWKTRFETAVATIDELLSEPWEFAPSDSTSKR
jgi:HTH-type transcriptional regulator, transcriptional repressor of NAD biosynthesis genes